MCDIALGLVGSKKKGECRGKEAPISDITRRIQLLLVDLKVNPTNDDNTTCRGNKRWSPPPPDILKVNIDGTFWEKKKHDAWGFVIRSHDGQAVMAGAGRLEHVHDALSAEMYACLEALKACSDQGMMRVIIESNRAALVSTMKKSGYELSPAGVLIEQARSFIMLNFINVEFLFSPRSCNVCAHELARIGFNGDPDQPVFWFDPLPEFVMSLVIHDCAGFAVHE
jgi:hypothetical protein